MGNSARGVSGACWSVPASPTRQKKGRASDPWAGSARPELATNPTTSGEIFAYLLKSGLVWTHTLPRRRADQRQDRVRGRAFRLHSGGSSRSPPAANAAKERPPPEVAQVIPGSARTCQRDVYLVWSAARETPFAVTNADLVRVADLKRLAGQLLVSEPVASGTKESDYRRIFFLRRLASALGLLQTDAGSVRAAPDPAFFSADPAERVRRASRAGATAPGGTSCGPPTWRARRAPAAKSATTRRRRSERRGARHWRLWCCWLGKKSPDRTRSSPGCR